MTDLDEHEKKRAEQEARAAHEKSDAEAKAKARANQLEQEIAKYAREKAPGLTSNFQGNKVVLLRNGRRLVISIQEGGGNWNYHIAHHDNAGFKPSDLDQPVREHNLSDEKMMDQVIKWLS